MFGTFWNQIMEKKKEHSIYFDQDSADYKDNETRFSYKM